VNSEHDGLKLMMGFGGGVPEVRNARASDSLYAVAIEVIFFKEGKRQPHPRHWQTLAELVGIASN
jgi:hypothetical protein